MWFYWLDIEYISIVRCSLLYIKNLLFEKVSLGCNIFQIICPFFFSMTRDRKRKTDRGVPLRILNLAAETMQKEGRTVRSVAREFDICHTTLYRFIKKVERLGPGEELRTGYWTSRRVFSDLQEKILADYLKTAADLFYGLCPKEVSKKKCYKKYRCMWKCEVCLSKI